MRYFFFLVWFRKPTNKTPTHKFFLELHVFYLKESKFTGMFKLARGFESQTWRPANKGSFLIYINIEKYFTKSILKCVLNILIQERYMGSIYVHAY
jgi:hypothetical protein